MRKQEEENRQKLAQLTDFPNKRRNMVIAGVVVGVAMLGYALLSGLVHVDFVEVETKASDRQAKLLAEERRSREEVKN